MIVFAIPVFLFFPFGAASLAATGKQLIWGFDDMPIGAMLAGLLAGGVIALLAFVFVCRRAWRGVLRVPLAITIVVAVFDCAAIPISRYITERVEHPERFAMILPNQGAAANRHPTGQSDRSGGLAAPLVADGAFPAVVDEHGHSVL